MPEAPVEPSRDAQHEHPVPTAWRPALRESVQAFVERDYGLSRGVRSVAPVSAETAEQIQGYVADYGETLAPLPDETWASSVAQWQGTYWEVLVDLWTLESGRSDMVLHANVFEAEGGFRIEVCCVHVP